jgi:hypothetical protein
MVGMLWVKSQTELIVGRLYSSDVYHTLLCFARMVAKASSFVRSAFLRDSRPSSRLLCSRRVVAHARGLRGVIPFETLTLHRD